MQKEEKKTEIYKPVYIIAHKYTNIIKLSQLGQ